LGGKLVFAAPPVVLGMMKAAKESPNIVVVVKRSDLVIATPG
jgi:hypothetical protein